jgi:hypothetical protein
MPGREEFGYVPRVSFDDGLSRIVDWHRDKPAGGRPLSMEIDAVNMPSPVVVYSMACLM